MLAPQKTIHNPPKNRRNRLRFAVWVSVALAIFAVVTVIVVYAMPKEQDVQIEEGVRKARRVAKVPHHTTKTYEEKTIKKDYSNISNWDLRHLSADETNNLNEAQVEYWKMFHPWPPPDENQPRVNKPQYAIFDTRADNEIAFVLSTEPGQMVIGKRNVGPGFEERFLKSITRPIIVKEDDSDYNKSLKRAVIAAKLELKDAYDRGEDIEKMMDDAREELQRLGRYRAELEKEAMKQLRRKDATVNDVEDLISAVNIMLENKGIAPIELNSMSRLALKLQDVTTKEEK